MKTLKICKGSDYGRGEVSGGSEMKLKWIRRCQGKWRDKTGTFTVWHPIGCKPIRYYLDIDVGCRASTAKAMAECLVKNFPKVFKIE